MFGDSRMKLFGAYGRYYDWTKYELARGSFGGDIWQVDYRSLDDPNCDQPSEPDNMPGRDLWGSATATATVACRASRPSTRTSSR